MNDETKRDMLEAVSSSLAHHSPCPLKQSATQPVPGEGNPNADIMFIGEAPGKQEDLTGKPFIGSAGKALNKLLARINLKREDVFITSIEKFRPPENRDPKPKEVNACLPYLERQIEIIEPKIIVPLGRHAAKTIVEQIAHTKLPGKSITEYHGVLIRTPSFAIFPMYHPAAMLYNASLAVTLEKDMLKLKEHLRAL